MILKIWDEEGGWIYFDRIERISIFPHDALGEGEDQGYEGGTYTDLKKKFKVAAIHRAWCHRTQQGAPEFVELAFNEGYLLGDDGRTIEKL